jgi:hypothetical protein
MIMGGGVHIEYWLIKDEAFEGVFVKFKFEMRSWQYDTNKPKNKADNKCTSAVKGGKIYKQTIER